MKKRFLIISLLIALFFVFSSCSLGTEDEWTLEKVYSVAVENGYEGSLEDFLSDFDGIDGVGIESVKINESGHLIVSYTDTSEQDAGLIIFTPDYEKITPSISENGIWLIGGEDTGISAVGGEYSKWHTGDGAPTSNVGKPGDFYLSTATLEVYHNTDGGWQLVGDILKQTPVHNSSVAEKKAVNEALLSSVSIRCYYDKDSDQVGSGVIYMLDKAKGDALILTNYHVVYKEEDSRIFTKNEISIYLYGLEYKQYAIEAEYVGGSETKDLALLRIKNSEILKNSSAREVKIANSDEISVLDKVFAIGNPLGDKLSATFGTVNVESEYQLHENGENVRVIRVDAPINPGNSGGGVFNVNGELIGIATLKVADADVDNMAYAIPSNVAALVSENLIYYSENYGNKKMKLFFDGITFKVSSVEMSYNEETGEIYKREILEISEIKAGSAAAVSECRVGDVIVSVEISGKKYSPQFIYQLAEYKYLIRPGDSLKYYLERDGASKTVEITVPTVGGFEFLK